MEPSSGRLALSGWFLDPQSLAHAFLLRYSTHDLRSQFNRSCPLLRAHGLEVSLHQHTVLLTDTPPYDGAVECPNCKQEGSYTGLLWVHCQNMECRYYDARYTEKVKQEDAASFVDTVEKLILLRGEIGD